MLRRVLVPLVVVLNLASSFGALSKTPLERITMKYVYSVEGRADFSRLPAVMDLRLAWNSKTIRQEIARRTGLQQEEVQLITTGFEVNAAPRLIESAGRLQYSVRFCSVAPKAGIKVDVEETLSDEGAAIIIPRLEGSQKVVTVMRDFLAPVTTDIVKLQKALAKEKRSSPEVLAGVTLIPSFSCEEEEK